MIGLKLQHYKTFQLKGDASAFSCVQAYILEFHVVTDISVGRP